MNLRANRCGPRAISQNARLVGARGSSLGSFSATNPPQNTEPTSPTSAEYPNALPASQHLSLSAAGNPTASFIHTESASNSVGMRLPKLCHVDPAVSQARAQEYRFLVGYSGDFTSVAEVARIHLRMIEKISPAVSTVLTPKGHDHGKFQRDCPLKPGY